MEEHHEAQRKTLRAWGGPATNSTQIWLRAPTEIKSDWWEVSTLILTVAIPTSQSVCPSFPTTCMLGRL